VRRFHINVIAPWRPVSVSAGAAGSRASYTVTPTTAPISVRRSAPWADSHGDFGANIGRAIPITPVATVLSSGDAIAADVWRVLHVDGPSDARGRNENSDGKVGCDHVSGLCDAATCPLAQMGSAIHTQTKMRL
jgi:hypothetical protein